MKIVNIYTDGACSYGKNNENTGGWGAVLEYKNHVKEIFGGEINTTNNRMEMIALLSALRKLKQTNLTINVFSDSSYLIECFNKKWYVHWMKNDWNRADNESPVKNIDLWKELIDYVFNNQIHFYKVKGHVNLNSKIVDFKAIYDKFIDRNGSLFTYCDFLYITKMNNRADELANYGIKEIRSHLPSSEQ